jgi:8-oxo-dGTP pyrophosphatase MutT (NUDIX family)
MTEEIRPAATVILWRQGPSGPEVLMGQRGAGAVFMPSKFVFPGGAVDLEDHSAHTTMRLQPLPLSETCLARLSWEGGVGAATLVAAALRELTEETGLTLRSDMPPMRFVFRAITPPGRSRRFDASFFLADAAGLAGDPQDFSAASGELAHLRWLPLPEARALDLPFITEVVLAEVAALVTGGDQPGVPFFDNSGTTPQFRRLL